MTAICGGALLAAVLGLIYTMFRIRRIERQSREALAEVDKFLNE